MARLPGSTPPRRPAKAHFVIRFAGHAGLAALFIAVALLGIFSGVMFAYAGDLRQISALDDYAPSAITRIYAANGETLGEFAVERRLVIGYDDISPDLWQAIISAEDTERCKPDPEGFLLALDALRSQDGEDIEAGHCLVIEDSLAGIQSAKAAGMWAVGVTHTYQDAELRASGADAVVDRLAELNPEWVARFFSPEVSP